MGANITPSDNQRHDKGGSALWMRGKQRCVCEQPCACMGPDQDTAFTVIATHQVAAGQEHSLHHEHRRAQLVGLRGG